MATYLDNAATTPMRPEAVEVMSRYLTENYANPSGGHRMARDARRALDDARDVIGAALGCRPGEVVFTAGGTEADNLAVFGVLDRKGGSAVCSTIEHHAVLHSVEQRGGRLAPVDSRGLIDLEALAELLDDDVSVVSIMLANNEVGTIQPLAQIAEVVRQHAPNAVLHTDAVQAFSWLDVAQAASVADMISISAHKFGGPKGVGALVVRDGFEVAAQIVGGGQERDRRSGTQNVAGIAAMAAAAEATVTQRPEAVRRLGGWRDRLADRLIEIVPQTVETGRRSDKVAGTCHLCFEGVESEALLFLMEQEEVYAAAASSCSSGAIEMSHVLDAMALPKELGMGSMRLSLGFNTTAADIDRALEVIPPAVAQLRSRS